MTPLFENDVKTYGTQTDPQMEESIQEFENDVKTYGTQTPISHWLNASKFENDVKTYGTQTIKDIKTMQIRLRMM